MAVRSTELRDGKVPEEERVRIAQQALPRPAAKGRIRWDRLPLVLLGWLILGLWWAAGGKYTIDGLPLLINEAFAFFRVLITLGRINHWGWYVGLCWLPVLISFAEHRYKPWRHLALSFIIVWVLIVWLIVSGIDAGSTYLAVTNPLPDAYTISKQVAAIKPLAAIWSILTTFGPEAGMAALWKWLRSG